MLVHERSTTYIYVYIWQTFYKYIQNITTIKIYETTTRYIKIMESTTDVLKSEVSVRGRSGGLSVSRYSHRKLLPASLDALSLKTRTFSVSPWLMCRVSL